MSLKDWLKNSKISIARVSLITGYSRVTIYNVINNKQSAPLELALTLYYLSGGEINLASMIYNTEEFLESIEDLANLTHKRRSQTIKDKYEKSMHEVRLL